MIDILFEFFRFLIKTKKYWLIPIAILLFLISFILVASQGSVFSPLIYTIF